MYTILQDMYQGDRTHISLTSKGRSEFRKDVAKFTIVIGLIFIIITDMIIQTINLKTAERNYSNHISDVRAESIHHLKVAISKLQ